MAALVTTEFRIHNAKQFREMFSEAALIGGTGISDAEETALSTNLYLFIGKSSAWSGNYTPPGEALVTFSDTSEPDPNNTNAPSSDTTANTSYSHWKDMIAAKKIASSDVSHVIARNNWVSARYYSMYDDTVKFSLLNSTQASQDVWDQTASPAANATASLYPMYVMNSTFKVYKCLSNGKTEGGRPQKSVVEPTHTTTTAAVPAAGTDGYVWKYMYTISAAESLKFVTSSYIPVKQIRDANAYGAGSTAGGMTAGTGGKDDGSDQVIIERNAIDGALDVFVITNDGGNYHFEDNIASFSGTGTSLLLSSPGLTTTNAYANSSVYFIYGGASYVRKVTSSSYDSGNARVTLTLDASLGVTLASPLPTCNVGPWPRIVGDGHGQEIVLTANSAPAANSVGGVTVVNSGNSFSTATLVVEAQVGASSGAGATLTPIIPPKGGHGYDAATELGGYFIMVNTKLTQSESGAFTTDNDFRKIGLLKDPNGNGTFVRYIADTADQAKTVTFSANNVAITGDITFTQAASGTGAGLASGYVVDVNASASTMRVIDVTNGTSSTVGYDSKPGSLQTGAACTSGTLTFTPTAIANGAMSIGSGEIIYIENRAPVARASDQTEDIKLIIEF